MTQDDGMLRTIDAVTVPVPDLDAGLQFYTGVLGHRLKWRNDDVSQAGLALGDGQGELVLTTRQAYEPNWLVDSVDACVARFESAGGAVVVPAFEIPVGRAAVVRDPFGNALVVLELSRGTYVTDETGYVTGVQRP